MRLQPKLVAVILLAMKSSYFLMSLHMRGQTGFENRAGATAFWIRIRAAQNVQCWHTRH